MDNTAKKVAVIMGSDSDLPAVKPAIDKLKSFGVPVEPHVMSAHRTPESAAEFAKNGVSINGVNQDLKPTMTDPGYDGEIQQLRVVTHLTDEETLRNTVKAVQALDFVTGDPSILRVLD